MFKPLKESPETLSQLPASLEAGKFSRWYLGLSLWNSPSASSRSSLPAQNYPSPDQTEQQGNQSDP